MTLMTAEDAQRRADELTSQAAEVLSPLGPRGEKLIAYAQQLLRRRV